MFDALAAIREVDPSDGVIVAVSGGKDSVATLDICCKHFARVEAYHLYGVPGIQFVNRYLDYLERRYKVAINRRPGEIFVGYLREGLYRARCVDIPAVKNTEIEADERRRTGLRWIANGMRKCDSLQRRGMLTSGGLVNASWGKLCPIGDWSDAQVDRYLRENSIPLAPITPCGIGPGDTALPVPIWRPSAASGPPITPGSRNTSPSSMPRRIAGRNCMARKKRPEISPGTDPAPESPASESKGQNLTRHQTFITQRVPRNMLNPAPYNPRVIDGPSRKRLKESIKRDGLVETLVWNRRTGTLVSGHQRLSVLDELEGHQDYDLEVAVIDVDEVRERELNVRLNNPQLAGSYDIEALQDLVKGIDGINLDALGFAQGDLRELFPEELDPEGLFVPTEDVLAEVQKLEQVRQATKDARPTSTPRLAEAPDDAGDDDHEPGLAEELAEKLTPTQRDSEADEVAKIQALKDRKKVYLEQQREADRSAYITLIFGSYAEVQRFIRATGLPDEAVQDGRNLCQALGIDLDQVE